MSANELTNYVPVLFQHGAFLGAFSFVVHRLYKKILYTTVLYQNPLSINSAKFSFSRYTKIISVAENRSFGVCERITNLIYIQSAIAALNLRQISSQLTSF